MAIPIYLKALHAAVKVRRRMRGPKRPSWTSEYEAFATLLHHYSKRLTRLPLSVQRGAIGALVQKTSIVKKMRFERVSARGVMAEWFRAPELDDSRVVLYLHGGGYSIGSIDSHRDLVSRICHASGASALVIDYRLAPEHPFPAQLDDARAAYRWLLDRGVDASRVVIAGESAGGGLTLSTLVATRDAGEPLPAAAIAISPWVDLEATGASMTENAPFDFISREVLGVYAKRFVRAHEMRHPLAAPLYADLEKLPPLLVQAGGAEALLDDGRRIAERAKNAGVDVTLEVDEDMVHVWHTFAAFCPPAQRAIDRAGAFARKHVDRASELPRDQVQSRIASS